MQTHAATLHNRAARLYRLARRSRDLGRCQRLVLHAMHTAALANLADWGRKGAIIFAGQLWRLA